MDGARERCPPRSSHSSGGLAFEESRPFSRLPGEVAVPSGVGGSLVKLVVMSLPDLVVIDQCEYSEWVRTGSPTRREGETSCEALIAHSGGLASLSEFIAGLVDGKEVHRADEQGIPPQCAFLGYGLYISPDGRYEREICQASYPWRGVIELPIS